MPGKHCPDTLDLRIVSSLEHHPMPQIPPGFAASLAARAASASPRVTIPTPHFGLWSIRIAFALTILALFLFTPTQSSSLYALAGEILLAVELVALTLWSTLRPTNT